MQEKFDACGRRAATAAIQGCFEVSARRGLVLVDPVRAAARVMEIACLSLPCSAVAAYKPSVLAAAALAVLLDERVEQLPGLRLLYAQALGSILQAALSGARLSRQEFSAALHAMKALFDFYRAWTSPRRTPFKTD